MEDVLPDRASPIGSLNWRVINPPANGTGSSTTSGYASSAAHTGARDLSNQGSVSFS